MSRIPFIQSSRLNSIECIQHGFFTRLGGLSGGIFTSLNCGLSSGDDLLTVSANRQRVTEELGLDVLYTLKQIHSADVVLVDEDSDPDDIIEADGLVTRRKGVGLGALGADCAPVLFVDREAGVVGSAHSGWQGALKGVTDCVIDRMCELGAHRQRIVCAIGPAIQWLSYEVGLEFREKLVQDSPIPASTFFRIGDKGGSIYFNLPGYIHARIQNEGVNQIDVLENDTYTDQDRFFSYRRSCHEREMGYGRQISVIGLAH